MVGREAIPGGLDRTSPLASQTHGGEHRRYRAHRHRGIAILQALERCPRDASTLGQEDLTLRPSQPRRLDMPADPTNRSDTV
jgi:hypothetical protein